MKTLKAASRTSLRCGSQVEERAAGDAKRDAHQPASGVRKVDDVLLLEPTGKRIGIILDSPGNDPLRRRRRYDASTLTEVQPPWRPYNLEGVATGSSGALKTDVVSRMAAARIQ